MLILPRTCFLHTPKTGGTWATMAIKASGIKFEDYRDNDGLPHTTLDQCPCPEKFKIAFVRHPLQMYQSYWRYKMGDGKIWRNNDLDKACWSNDFHDFVRNVLKSFPGVASQSLKDFVGPPGAEIEFIGKYETLVDDLIKGLKMGGEEFDEKLIRNYPPQNISNQHRFLAEYTPELEKAVRESERIAIERFGYV